MYGTYGSRLITCSINRIMAAILKLRLATAGGRQIAPEGIVSIRRLVRMSQLLDKVPDVDIDGHGRFKYILIDVQDDVGKASKKIVRGYARAQWHGLISEYNNNARRVAAILNEARLWHSDSVGPLCLSFFFLRLRKSDSSPEEESVSNK